MVYKTEFFNGLTRLYIHTHLVHVTMIRTGCVAPDCTGDEIRITDCMARAARHHGPALLPYREMCMEHAPPVRVPLPPHTTLGAVPSPADRVCQQSNHAPMSHRREYTVLRQYW